jgi:two-component system LytT family response regulator
MKILVVDDEALARKRILKFLGETGLVCEVREAENGLAGLEALRAENFDIVFLDVQMPGLTGLEMLGQLPSRKFQVVFQTAHDEHALSAFEENACDYLLKPFTAERFRKALDRALERGALAPASTLESDLLRKNGYLCRIVVKVGAKSLLVPTEEIFAFVSEQHYTTVVTRDREHVIDLPLNQLEDRLDPNQCQRLHRNNLVALNRVRSVTGGENMEVELESGRKLPVSRSNRHKLKP